MNKRISIKDERTFIYVCYIKTFCLGLSCKKSYFWGGLDDA